MVFIFRDAVIQLDLESFFLMFSHALRCPLGPLSRSLSESSPSMLELYRRLKDETRGLWRLLPLPRGPSRLGRRKRRRKGLKSSEADWPTDVDGDDGRAKSDEDVGKDGRVAEIESAGSSVCLLMAGLDG